MIEIDGFAVSGELGRGGFGTVYRATDHAHGRDVALKVLERLGDEGARRRFDRERRAMGTLSGHPNIAVVYSSGFTPDERPFIVMELLGGGSLADLLSQRGPLGCDEVVAIGLQLCDALAHAHAGGVLHLDMKPDNVLLSEFGNVKIVDFGIAALLDDKRTTAIRATPAFADPRVLEGEDGTVSSDIYGLAATLYTLLAGGSPYESTSGLATFNRIANDPVPRLTRADVPSRLADCLQRAMSKEPSGRPATMPDLRRELSAAMQPVEPHAVTASNAPGLVAPGVEGGRDRSSTIGITLLVLAALLLAGFAAYALSGGADTTTDGDGPAISVVSSEPDEGPEPTIVTTTLDTTGAPTTTAVPAVRPVPVGPAATNPRFSLQTTDGLPDPEIFVVPDGSTSLCLTWAYVNVAPGAAFVFEWSIDGVLDDGSRSTGTNQGASAGDFFGCITNDGGLPSGLYEASWTVDGQPVFIHGLQVGGASVPVTVAVENNGAVAVCDVHWSPVGASTIGLPANVDVIEPGERFEMALPTGRYATSVRDCAGGSLFDAADTEFTAALTPAQRTLTLS